MTFTVSPHLVTGEGRQVGIITLWTKKEHVLAQVPSDLYAVCSQLYSRDEGISRLMRGLLSNPGIRDLIVVGADLNTCGDTLIALFENGVSDGRVIGAPGYLDTEIPADAVDRIRQHVEVHDLRKEKDYGAVAEYVRGLPEKDAWGEPETYPEPRITPPEVFPTADQHALRSESIERAAIDLAHRLGRFGALANVQSHLTERGRLPERLVEQDAPYTRNLLEDEEGTYGQHLHKDNRLGRLVSELTERDDSVITFGDDVEEPLLELIQITRRSDGLHLSCHVRRTTLAEFPLLASAMFSLLSLVAGELDEPAGSVTVSMATLEPSRYDEELRQKPLILRRTGDPRSNILVRIKDDRIWVTHLSPDGKRLEEFSGERARDLYKRLVVEHRITDLSHAAYLGYELARAEEALRSGGMYEQDA